jgi:hypothetical protein
MREDLLHFIWQFRYFNHQHLFTESGETVQVLFPGELNRNQGPDFSRARIRIGGEVAEGSVELHVKASDWFRHGHATDEFYRETILHVVWENDTGVATIPRPGIKEIAGDRPIPTLVLQDRVPKLLLGQYEQWMKSGAFVPCEGLIGQVPAAVRAGWQRQLLVQRLQHRALFIRQCLEQTRQHWEEVTWWLMARSLGQPVNSDTFEAIGRSIPVRLLLRHRQERIVLEALLLGQAGLLGREDGDPYLVLLQQEYRFLRAKYQLQPITLPILFHRMRPAHFPTIRLRQLAALLAGATGWFTRVREAETSYDLMAQIKAEATDRWTDHSAPATTSWTNRPGPPAEPAGMPGTDSLLAADLAAPVRRLGEDMKRGLLINAFIPLLYAYGWLRDEPEYREKALRWLEELGPESNVIIKGWQRLGITAENAADSQALLELKKCYCNARRCLDCDIGRALLRKF